MYNYFIDWVKRSSHISLNADHEKIFILDNKGQYVWKISRFNPSAISLSSGKKKKHWHL